MGLALVTEGPSSEKGAKNTIVNKCLTLGRAGNQPHCTLRSVLVESEPGAEKKTAYLIACGVSPTCPTTAIPPSTIFWMCAARFLPPSTFTASTFPSCTSRRERRDVSYTFGMILADTGQLANDDEIRTIETAGWRAQRTQHMVEYAMVLKVLRCMAPPLWCHAL